MKEALLIIDVQNDYFPGGNRTQSVHCRTGRRVRNDCLDVGRLDFAKKL